MKANIVRQQHWAIYSISILVFAARRQQSSEMWKDGRLFNSRGRKMELGGLLKVGFFIGLVGFSRSWSRRRVQGGLRGMVRVLGGEVDGERQTEVQDYRNQP